MKLNGRTLKRRLFGLTTIPSRLARVRYFRGHGVHSPFVYQLVRQVFMRRFFLTEERGLYDLLRAGNLSSRRAMQLQNLALYCGYDLFAVDGWKAGCDLLILTTTLAEEEVTRLVKVAAEAGATVALLDPYEGRQRAACCKALIAAHSCTSVDNRGYLLLFSNPDLPKQHYRI